MVQAIAEAVKVAKAHDEGTPAVRVDSVGVAGEKQAFVDVGANDANLEGEGGAGLVGPCAEGVNGFEDGF